MPRSRARPASSRAAERRHADATIQTVTDISVANAAFWNEPCGTGLAREIGLSEITSESLARYDASYFGYYPYLRGIINRAGVAGAEVLEIGLGYGTLGQYLASRAKAYQGLDIAEEPVRLMGLRLQAAGLGERFDARQGSALDIPFGNDSFDVVVAIGTLHHTGDLERSVAEVRRVLRPNGRAVVMVYNRHSLRLLGQSVKSRVKRALGRDDSGRAEKVRAMYDVGSGGAAAPHTDFVTVGDAQRLFRDFSSVRVEQRNFDAFLLLGRQVIPRLRLLGNADRLMGLDLYITATK